MSGEQAGIRLDKWLWQARFFKTRTLANRIVAAGSVRINATRMTKAATIVRPSDVLTFTQADHVRIVRIIALGERRGPATEALGLYEDLTPPSAPEAAGDAARTGGRPSKKDRRAIDALRGLTP